MHNRTSETDPILIAELEPPSVAGIIGVTFCPGKKDPWGDTIWDRDLDSDLDAIVAWGAAAVVTLVEAHELTLLGVTGLEAGLARRGVRWFHLPIVDISVPDQRFEERWEDVAPIIHALLEDGKHVLVHCRGGLGRAGTIAACLLVDFGIDPETAIRDVRAARKDAIQTRAQENYVRAYRRMRST